MRIVLTFTGSDKPGIVHHLAEIVRGHGGNWQDSRMARLAGRFAGILDVVIPDEQEQSLRTALQELAEQGIRVLIDTGESTADTPVGRCRLECTATDRHGIVQSITEVLLSHTINVVASSSTTTDAPMGGGSLFRATATLALPAAINLGDVHQDLETIADDLLVELYTEDRDHA